MRTLSMSYRIFSVISLLFLFASAGFAADIDPFVGNYTGFAEFESGGETARRDMSVEIAGNDDGFEITWKSVTYKPDGRTKEKEYNIMFVPTRREGIFSSAMGTNVFGKAVPLNPMKGDPYVWSRITGDTFTVFSLLIGEDGGYEMQEYNRTLAERGLELDYQRIRNGEKLKKINAFLAKQ